MLKGKKIIIGITGSIAAFKIPYLIRLLIHEEAEVRVIMTPVATRFVTPLTLATLSQNPVIVEPFEPGDGTWNSHVELGLWADIMILAPVTANTLGKMVNGIADNMVVTAYLSAKCPVFIAPAMDLDMFQHPSTQRNLSLLKSFGNTIIEPQVGELASGLTGPGRLEEPEKILEIVKAYFAKINDFHKKKILITAGPTYEKIDPVRFIGNYSTGKMGFALAEQAATRGADVLLITGPTELTTRHRAIQRIDVTSAEEMYLSCMEHAPKMNIIIMAAAVADYTVKNQLNTKLKKSTSTLSIALNPTKDILWELGKNKKKNQVLVGFALETNNEIENAYAKLKAKNLDFIVLNSLNDLGAGFGGSTNKVSVIERNGKIHDGSVKNKYEVASDILDIICERLLKN
ncbi:MAG: bifunctional phosphopantothenoylcysteine decarboxylase/phosphopantothenate--cysteine ligase CoaBC [Bacteroidales bacterium]|jgi:phosphopantothenoylcysteine decarboxylase/phosphopantothenate--cysteine ligase|nr:bifunctional phosphopantothenoylcysteine decarboxylase/phosphopantothenate--cysteine ligase CoaBC [Bacteroidales bacterium]